jgi:hypothetical protein
MRQRESWHVKKKQPFALLRKGLFALPDHFPVHSPATTGL